MSSNTNLYKKVVDISEEFLGPAGERFMRRQIETHFDISAEKIQARHLPELVDWTRLTFNMITNDPQVVNDFANRLLGLNNNGKTANTKK